MENEREPIEDLETLAKQDERDMRYGYFAGLHGDGTEPSLEMNRSYWHGWYNGMVDSGRMTITASQAILARKYLDRQKNMARQIAAESERVPA